MNKLSEQAWFFIFIDVFASNPDSRAISAFYGELNSMLDGLTGKQVRVLEKRFGKRLSLGEIAKDTPTDSGFNGSVSRSMVSQIVCKAIERLKRDDRLGSAAVRSRFCYPSNPVSTDQINARRYSVLRELFDETKTSQAERIVEDLGLSGDPSGSLDDIVDQTIKRQEDIFEWSWVDKKGFQKSEWKPGRFPSIIDAEDKKGVFFVKVRKKG